MLKDDWHPSRADILRYYDRDSSLHKNIYILFRQEFALWGYNSASIANRIRNDEAKPW